MSTFQGNKMGNAFTVSTGADWVSSKQGVQFGFGNPLTDDDVDNHFNTMTVGDWAPAPPAMPGTHDMTGKGFWYPDYLYDQTNIAACTLARGVSGVVTVDDIVDGKLCHFDKATGDLCLHSDLITDNTDADRDSFVNNIEGFTSGTLIPAVNNTDVIEERWPHVTLGALNNIAGLLDDSATWAAAGSLIADGGNFAVKDAENYVHYAEVTGIDMRGLKSSCGTVHGTFDTDAGEGPWKMYKDDDLSSNADLEELNHEVVFNYFSNAKKLDLSDFKEGRNLRIGNMPRLQHVNLDALVYINEFNLFGCPSLTSIYLPNLHIASSIQLRHNTNMYDVVAPKWTVSTNDVSTGDMLSAYNMVNLHTIVIGCMYGPDATDKGDFDHETGLNNRGQDNGSNLFLNKTTVDENKYDAPDGHNRVAHDDHDYVNWDYVVNAINNRIMHHQPEECDGVHFCDKMHARKDGRQSGANSALAHTGSMGELLPGGIIKPGMDDADWELIGGYNGTHMVNELAPAPDPAPAPYYSFGDRGTQPFGYGLINYCGEETFQYDRMHDTGAALEFRMNVRCDVNRNQEQLALGHKYAAVIELQNAPAHKQVLLAWNRKAGETVWSPSPKCSKTSTLNAIDENNGQMARGRADGSGYVKFRQYLEKCDTYVYQAIADPQSKDCEISKMVYGQSNRGNALVAGTSDLRTRGRGGQAKLNLRQFVDARNKDKMNPRTGASVPKKNSKHHEPYSA